MDTLSVIASTIAVVQAISLAYEAIQHLKGMPKEFDEVNQSLPLVQDTLSLARDQLRDLDLDESSRRAIESVLSDCHEKAIVLRDIFQKVDKGKNDAKDGSVLDFYRTTLLRLGKAHRVENLMQGILKGLKALAINQLFRTATQSQIIKLEQAIDRLSHVESSVPDMDFESSSTNITQNIAEGGTGYQPVNRGHAQYNNFSTGRQFNAETMNFVCVGDYQARRRAILQALYTSPYLDRKDRNPDRVPGTCEWFVDHKLFRQWRESKSSSMLWVSADPGCGKSVLTKYLVDSVLPTTESKTTCYFFFKDDFEDQRSAKSALRCILHQLFMQRQILFSNKIVNWFEAYKAHHTGSFDRLWDILVMASEDKNSGEIVCILDAFDECEDEERSKLARALCQLYGTRKNFNLKFLVTSRPYGEIRRGFQPPNILELPIIHLSGESETEMKKIAREIGVYIEARVRSIQAILKLKPDEEQLLLKGLLDIPNPTYLWVYLTLDLVQSDINIDKTGIKRAISYLPPTVDNAYERILAKSRNSEEAKKLLHIVVAAVRPLTLSEMSVALALQQNHRSYKDLGLKSEQRFHEYVRDLCGLFVTITGSKIYLLHQTAREFLVQDGSSETQNSHKRKWKSSLQPRDSHRYLWQICIQHLFFTEFETHPLDENGKLTQYLEDYVFLDYSAKNWAVHFRVSGIKDKSAIEILLTICEANSKRCLTWFRIYWASAHTDFPQDFTTLMIASYFGLEQVVKLLLKRDNVEVNSRDGMYQRSALSWASENGFDGIVKLLIRGPTIRIKDIVKLLFSKGAEVDARDKYKRTPLSYAAWNGHTAVIKLLVKAGACVDLKDEIGGTPISYALCTGQKDVANQLMKGGQVNSVDRISRKLLLSAAKKGHEVFVKRLLERGTHTEAADKRGRTPLLLAAMNGHEAIVRLLLDNGAITEASDKNSSWTPLLWAAKYGHAAIVQLLLDKGAAIEAADERGRTALLLAAMTGHEVIVRLLLDKGTAAEVSDKNSSWRTLLWAAKYGHAAIVQLLLDKGAAIEAADKEGWTPLLLAAMNGHEAIMWLLLDEGATIETADKRGRTPLLWAAINGHKAIVQLLLDKGAATETANKKSSRTPLLWASKYGHTAIVQLLLDKGAAIEAADKRGRTPLLLAAMNGHEAVVQLLLDKGTATEAIDKRGWTPLSWAVINRYVAIVRLLLDKGAAIEAADIWGWTPLSWAAMNGHVAIVRLLLDKGAVIEAADNWGYTPLSWAAMAGQKAIEQLLLDEGAAAEVADKYSGWTPLSWAAMNGHEAIVRLLLEKGAATEVADKNSGWTPLSWAAMNKHEAIVRLLLDKGAVIEVTDNWGYTPLSWAAMAGQKAIEQLLLDKGAATEVADKNSGQTPLSWAAMNGHEAIVQPLLDEGAEGAASKATDKNSSWTPLLWAAKYGHAPIVQLLLDKGAAIEAADKEGRTPLLLAAINGHEAIVRLLLEKGAATEVADKNSNWTPLSWAAINGHEAIVQLLLDKGAATDVADKNSGQTPLSWAAKYGHEAIVRLLLNKGAAIEAADNWGHTPLSWAAMNRHKAIERLLRLHSAQPL